MNSTFEWNVDSYRRVGDDGVILYVAGWVGGLWDIEATTLRWYARTVLGSRAEFDTKEEAMQFIQMICNTEKP